MSSKIIIILGFLFCVAVISESKSGLVKVVLNKKNSHKHNNIGQNDTNTLPPCSNTTQPGNKMAPCLNNSINIEQNINGTSLNSTEEEGLKIIACDKKHVQTSIIQKIEVSGCTKFPCVFKRGESPKIRVLFTPSKKVNEMKLSIAGIIQSKSVPFPYNDNNHCTSTIQELKLKSIKNCNLNRDKLYTYEFSMPILTSYPPISLYVHYNVKHGEKSLFCFLLPVRIV